MYVSGPLRQWRLSNSARDQVTEQKRLTRTSCRCSCLAGVGGGAGGESPTLILTPASVYSTRRLPTALGSSYRWCLVGPEITQSLDSCGREPPHSLNSISLLCCEQGLGHTNVRDCCVQPIFAAYMPLCRELLQSGSRAHECS